MTDADCTPVREPRSVAASPPNFGISLHVSLQNMLDICVGLSVGKSRSLSFND